MGLRYGGKIISDYSAMQGPAPDGFHIPLDSEFQDLIAMMNSIGIDSDTQGSSYSEYLKIPLAGYRSGVDSTVSEISEDACLWSSSPDLGITNSYLLLYPGLGEYEADVTDRGRVDGCSLRCFKDTPVAPNSSWTNLYGTNTAGIFHNATLGLISIVDGNDIITIADKNLGATTVWDVGDTLTSNNCGNYYQRGNNYGFPFTGTVTTSSTQVDTTGYGPGNYYSSSTFIEAENDRRSSVPNANLWGGGTGVQQRPAQIVKRYYGGKLVNDYSAMRGPCDEGFHIPVESERQTIKTAVETWWSGSGAGQVMALASYLKIPLAGYLARTTGALSGQGNRGTYWMCTSPTSDKGRSFDIQSSSISFSNAEKGLGQSIRPFKDIPVVPDSNWTVEYQRTGTAGIYSNSTLGLISISSDGTNWITIADKNVGATTVYSYTDVLSESNCGYFFQRGNNYGFPYTGAVTTSSTAVNTTGYGPGNYYSNSTFIKKANWSSSTNYNLRGGETGVQQRPAQIAKMYYGGKLVNDYSAMQGPAPDGFHIPTSTEWTGVRTIMVGLGFSTGNSWATNLHLPLAKHIKQADGSIDSSDSKGYYFASTPGTGTAMYRLYMTTSAVTSTGTGGRASGYSIRAFKDGFVTPTSSWTVINGTLGGAGIFRDQANGLISITSDGTTGYTIMDKNLGATTVYNYGDTLSEANCGKFFQRGNNYCFPRTGPTTTSSTAIDTTGYGPGNYYNNGTFITITGDWSSPSNDNLRGGVTGVKQIPTLIRERP